METLELIGVGVGLIYLYLEYRANIWLWLAGIVMPALYIAIYYHSGFYADMGINVYYLMAGIYGWLKWCRGRNSSRKEELHISHTPKKIIMPLFLCCFASFIAICFVLINFTDSTIPYGDSFTTAVSIAGLWMLAKKYVEQWLVWLVVDVVCAFLYLYKGLYPTAILYALYSVIAVAGYYKWLKLMKQ